MLCVFLNLFLDANSPGRRFPVVGFGYLIQKNDFTGFFFGATLKGRSTVSTKF